jgi:tetratricopeptide (TPR) repeat protein
MRSLAITICCALLFSAAAQGQNVPSAPESTCVLTVRIKLHNERSPIEALEVQLLTRTDIAIYNAYTHGDGSVEFRDVHPGAYKLKVIGDKYETAMSEPFEIERNESGKIESMYITPKASEDANVSGPPLIAVSEMNVPDKAKSQLDKGMQAFAQGKADTALEHIRKAIQIYPAYAQAHNNLGIVLVSRGDDDGAKKEFNEALKINEKFTPPLINLARVALKEHDVQQADGFLQKSIKLGAKNAEALSILANVRFIQGRFTDALQAVNDVHAVPHQNLAEVHLIAAEIYQKESHNEDALRECQTFLTEAPNSPKAGQVRKAMAVIETRK